MDDNVRYCDDGEGGEGQTLSTPDTVVTSTPSEVTPDNTIVLGDFDMDMFHRQPQLTLFLIKPDGVRHTERIESRLRDEGFTIVQKRVVHITPEQASNLYYEHYGEAFFPSLVTTISQAPISVYVVRRKDAVDMMRHVVGPWDVAEAQRENPESLRAQFGTPGEAFMNVCHCSATSTKALEDIRFFFPKMILDPNFRDLPNAEDYLNEFVNPTLKEGLAQVCRYKPLDPVVWLAEWLLTNNPNKPKMTKTLTMTAT